MGNQHISVPFRWSRGVWTWTIVTGVIFWTAGLYLYLPIWRLDEAAPLLLRVKSTVVLVIVGSVVGTAAYMPIRLQADGERIRIRRLFGTLEIPLSEVTDAKPISELDLDDSIRTFGSGDFFGYLGRFRNKRLGNYTMYATDLNRLIRVDTARRKYVFSCERPEEFAEFVRGRLGA